MLELTRQENFAQASKRLRQDFDELSIVPHSALRDGQAERLVRDSLNGHLPKRFSAGAGFIIDPLLIARGFPPPASGWRLSDSPSLGRCPV